MERNLLQIPIYARKQGRMEEYMENVTDNGFSSMEEGKVGTVQIANDVVAMIAGIAATEVEGVSAMAGNITNELMGKVGMRKLTKGVKVMVRNGEVEIDLGVIMEYGYNIPATCQKVQERVKTSIENMTGFSVTDVNIRIAGVNMPKNA